MLAKALTAVVTAAAAFSQLGQAQTTPADEKWAAAYEKANTALARLSQNEKIGIVSGVGWGKGACVGNTGSAGSINYPSLCLQDGPLGLRHARSVTAFAPAIQAASTWDVELIRQRGQYMGEEAKGIGVHVLLGPVAGALGKIPAAGRNWEAFGPDPYLTGIAMIETIEGIQSAGVQACAKHYILNEQERNRETMSSSVDDRTMHELYLWPFADSVKANVASVMCSYNKINGTWACESQSAMQKLLKDELGFPGYVVSDWNAQHTTAGSANGGMDMTMPGSDFDGRNILWGPQLQSAVQQNAVSAARLDDMVRRVLASWYYLGQDSGYPQVNMNANVQGNHKENARAVARDGIVLLKNDGNLLPLKKPAKIAVIGSSTVVNSDGLNACPDRGCNKGALAMGWGSGTVDLTYLVAPHEAIKARADKEGIQVSHSPSDDGGAGAQAAQGADIAFVFVTADSGEGYIEVEGHGGDRNHLDPWHDGNRLVQQVAAANPNTIVVVHSVGPILLESILQNTGVKGIVWAGLPGQENGNALVDVLFGDTNPNGKLPYTIGKRAEDWGAAVVNGDDNFREGLYIDYRHFDKQSIEPRYEFGFGLSYTTFEYSDISVSSTATPGPATGTLKPGGPEDLYEIVATITATITNSGEVDGAEVAQLYVTYPSSAPETPPKQLRGFQKLKLKAGEAGEATFNVRRKDISFWDVGQQKWVVPEGEFKVAVGASSRDLRLDGAFTVA
ncbi:putative beta-glucosidase L [Scedosporium apiospermum]|uniref:Beta-glucosidase cel3A n=1 Tax=Pseudallescheria apiosperma TaxID=563466 RepID=A0A084GEL3_PSEDA|nr:putative beta-glucosidase L [Scedosporium apiospermum]KEZ45775.1 putative beta-glucosidase L [Scedosporium apiospermum]